jgi:hypothetical protein
MSSLVFLISMGLVIYFLLQGDKQDRLDRQQAEDDKKTLAKQSKAK